jgi:transcriptional regulator with XRE-family HTH domain
VRTFATDNQQESVLRCPDVRAGADDDHSTADTGDSRTPSFGVLLRQMRVAAGLSQQALAERAGLSRKALTALEGGHRRRPRPATVALLAHALDVGPRERAALVAASAGAAPTSARRPIGRRSNLPVPPTPFLGRDVEVAAATRILDPTHSEVRLLTLLGLGGVGKTRLALAVAEAVGDAYADGVVFIDWVPMRAM